MCALLIPWAASAVGESAGLYPYSDALGLEDYMQRVVNYNESVQARLLGFHAARRQRMAEMGTFEPALVASAEFVDRRQANTHIGARTEGWIQEAFDASFNRDNPYYPGPPPNDLYPYVFEERNRRYSSVLEMQTPYGTRLQFGGFADDIRRNSPITSDSPQEGYQTRLGLVIEQPLLKGLGSATNLASLRLAARQSEIAFQEYRRELMGVVAEAELAYWELYYSQQELQLTRESVAVAETLLADGKASLEAGRGARLDVLEAEAGLAIRRSRERESYQRRINALNRLASFFGGVPREHRVDYKATDAPVSVPVETFYDNGLRTAVAMNPDFLKARLQTEQERIRLGYAQNQKLPEVNLRADIGPSGFGYDWNSSWEDTESYNFPAWTVGVVVRLPLWGDVRGKNESRAARLRLMQAERTESNLLTQLRVGNDTSEQRVASSYLTARSLESVVEFRTSLLDTRMQSRDIGRMDARSVLEAEQELFVARLEQLQSEVEHQRSLLELQLIAGNLLQLRNLEVDFKHLEERTTYWIRAGERKTPGMDYQRASFDRLPMEEPMAFHGDPVRYPWLGVDWDSMPMKSYDTPYDEADYLPQEPEEERIPRRFDGSHIP